jgi:D-alanyl-D-alanine carboxypeptidase
LGDLIERATGLPQAAAYRSLIDFDRIGQPATWFETLEPAPAAAPPRAGQYIGGNDIGGVDPSFDLYGGGGLVSTLQDQARFISAVFSGKVFHKAATLKLMTSIPAVVDTEGAPSAYALGIHKVVVDGVERLPLPKRTDFDRAEPIHRRHADRVQRGSAARGGPGHATSQA